MRRPSGPDRRWARRARAASLAGLGLLAGCVDIPEPAAEPDGAVSFDRGSPDSAPDVSHDATPPDDAAAPEDTGPRPDRAPDASPRSVTCPAPCPHARQAAAYLPADRADALHVLDDGSVLLTLTVRDVAALHTALEAAGPLPRSETIQLPDDLEQAGEDGVQILMHVEGDLSAVLSMHLLAGTPVGPIVDLWRGPAPGPGAPPLEMPRMLYLVARHGAGRIEDGGPRPDRGYVVIGPMPPPGREVAIAEADARLVAAGPRYQAVPPGAADRQGFVAVDGDAVSITTSRARWFDIDGPRALDGLRHHVIDGPPGFHFGRPPPEALYSTLPLQAGDRCALRTSADEPGGPQVYLAPVDDGNGGVRVGRRPLDAFAGGACPVPDPAPGMLMVPPPVGGHGWSMAPGASASVSGVAVDRPGATYFGLDARASRGDEAIRVPAVVSYAADGALRWFQRLRRDTRDGLPVISDHHQIVQGLAFDGDADPPAVVIMAEGRTDDTHPLWTRTADGSTGFQARPDAVGGSSASGWIGRLDAEDGRFLGATWIYRVTADPAPDRMRTGRLSCFIDESTAPGVPQRVQLAPGRIAIGPDGQVAVAGTGVGLSNTPDALQQTEAPFDSPSARFVRIYDRTLTTLLYSTAIGPLPLDAEGRLGLDIEIGDMAFTPEGDLLVVGTHVVRDSDGDGVDDGAALPTTHAPPWTGSVWPPEDRADGGSRGFILRLVPDPSCGI